MLTKSEAIRPTDTEVADRLAFAKAGLALAGHEVADPALRAILEAAARHEISDDEASEVIHRHVQG